MKTLESPGARRGRPSKAKWETLVKAREAKGISQEELADACGVTQGAVSGWELGLYFPALSYLPAISAALGISVNDLLLNIPAVFLTKNNSESVDK